VVINSDSPIMRFQKQDLEGTHYHWSEKPDFKVFSGQPSRRLFDREDGDQVLFIINVYASLSDKFTVEEGKKIEYQITHNLPLEAKSEISVFNWIRDASTHSNAVEH